MESVVEGLLYVQGDIGLTLKDIERILEIDEDEAKSVVLKLKNYYDEGYTLIEVGDGDELWKNKSIWSIAQNYDDVFKILNKFNCFFSGLNYLVRLFKLFILHVW